MQIGYEIIDPAEFLTNGILREDAFYEKAGRMDWELFRNKRVLIRGCASKMIPPWVYMFLVGKLSHMARLVYYGSEEDKIIVFQTEKKAIQTAKNNRA